MDYLEWYVKNTAVFLKLLHPIQLSDLQSGCRDQLFWLKFITLNVNKKINVLGLHLKLTFNKLNSGILIVTLYPVLAHLRIIWHFKSVIVYLNSQFRFIIFTYTIIRVTRTHCMFWKSTFSFGSEVELVLFLDSKVDGYYRTDLTCVGKRARWQSEKCKSGISTEQHPDNKSWLIAASQVQLLWQISIF